MEFKTLVEYTDKIHPIGYQDKILLLGSCFAESIGKLLVQHKFNCNINPFGILYNPISLAEALQQIIDAKVYAETDLLFHLGNYHSYMHHGHFSAPVSEESLKKINSNIKKAHSQFPELTYIFLTFGTSWAYTLKSTGKIVSNCHKVPMQEFERNRLSVFQITERYKELIKNISAINPNIKFLFTVSPIRHIKDGLHENQLSKSTLLLAIDEIQKRFPDKCFYFPSYEILIDELRDYRYYAEDMIHPSNVSIQYLWGIFSEKTFSKETKNILKEYESIRRDINHKPFYPDSDEHKRFLEQLVLKIYRIKRKHPNFDIENELQICLTQLKK